MPLKTNNNNNNYNNNNRTTPPAEISSKEYTPGKLNLRRNIPLGSSSSKILWIILKRNDGGTQTNEQKDKEFDAQTREMT